MSGAAKSDSEVVRTQPSVTSSVSTAAGLEVAVLSTAGAYAGGGSALMGSCAVQADGAHGCPGDLLEKYPQIPRFVKQHSAVWRAVKDTPNYRWVACLPLHEKPLQRCLVLLQFLSAVHEMPCDPVRIFRCRTEPLWPELADRGATELREMLELAEYLQLPKSVCTRLLQHEAAHALRNTGGAGATPEFDAFDTRKCRRGGPMLGPLLTQAMAKTVAGRFPDMFKRRTLDCASVLKASNAAADGALGTPAHLVRRGLDAAAPVLYLCGAILGGHVAGLEPMMPFPNFLDPEMLYDSPWAIPVELAAGAGDVQLLERLYQADWPCDMFTAYTAAAHDRIAVVALLDKWSNSKLDDECIYFAALHGHAAAVFWLRIRGGPWDVSVTHNAALGGHRGLLEALCEANCSVGPSSWTSAIKGGHSQVLEVLHAFYTREGRELPWEVTRCHSQSRNG
jgi:hypothetical protein